MVNMTVSMTTVVLGLHMLSELMVTFRVSDVAVCADCRWTLCSCYCFVVRFSAQRSRSEVSAANVTAAFIRRSWTRGDFKKRRAEDQDQGGGAVVEFQ